MTSLEGLAIDSGPKRSPRELLPRPRFVRLLPQIIVFVIYLSTVVLLQWASGAYHCEFGGYPDEPAHYVTSRMVHAYLTSPELVSPMKFAQAYYNRYPKVAFGHWPPLFYLVQGVWMILFSTSRASVLLELALTTTALAYMVFREARQWFGWKAGFGAGLVVICLPIIQTYSAWEMSETLLTFLCLCAALSFGRFLESGQRKDSLWFAIFFSLAVLTKGSGWLLALLAPIAMILTRKLRLFRERPFWYAVALIAVACVPWQLKTMQWAAVGWTGGTTPTISYSIKALEQFFQLTVGMTGVALFVLVGVGIFIMVVRPFRTGSVSATPAVLFALITADWLFHSIVPAGIEDRKMIIAIPALVWFAFAGAFAITDLSLGRIGWAKRRRGLVATTVVAAFAAGIFSIPKQKHYGYIEAANFIATYSAFRTATILVSSESGGEGLLISEVALREGPSGPSETIVRATKALAEVSWNVSDYKSRFSSPGQMVNFLKDDKIGFVVVDSFPPDVNYPHSRILKAAIQDSWRFQLVATFAASPRKTDAIRVYRFHS